MVAIKIKKRHKNKEKEIVIVAMLTKSALYLDIKANLMDETRRVKQIVSLHVLSHIINMNNCTA